MNKIRIKVSSQTGLLSSLRIIGEEMEKIDKKDVLVIDLTEANFELGHHFFSVLRKRYGERVSSCIIPSGVALKPLEQYGFEIISESARTEFEKEFSKKNILRHNFTVYEYFLYELKRIWGYFVFFVEKHRKGRKYVSMPSRGGNFFLIITGLIVSISLLLFIFYFAVSKTFVYIEPQVTIRPTSTNIIFSEATGATILAPKNLVNVRRTTISFSHTMKFDITEVDPNSIANSRGTITVYNELSSPQTLKPNTRFVSDDGLVFRSEGWANLPPSKTINGISQIGSVEITVIADGNDISGKPIGDRGNIGDGVNLAIPGLKFNRDKIYARSKGTFAGGRDARIRVLTQVELDRFQSLLKEQTKKFASEELLKNISNENKIKGENYALLSGDTLGYDNGNIQITDNLKIGDFADEIEITMSLTVTGLFYDKNRAIEHLTEVFHDSLLNGTDKEVAIHKDSLRISNIISRTPETGEIKATMEMDTTITYDFENPLNELTKQMKILIAGLDEPSAKLRIANTGYAKEVTIKFSPFWIRRVSSNMDNIEFIIRK